MQTNHINALSGIQGNNAQCEWVTYPVKRSKVIAKMKKEDIQVVFWQETHLSNAEHEKLKKMGFINTFYSSHKSGRKRGVAILLSNKIQFQLTSQIKDKEGRYILVKGKQDNKEVTLLNVYMPPDQDKSFIKKIFDLLILESSGTLIWGETGIFKCNLNLTPQTLTRKKVRIHCFCRKY